MAKRTKRTTKTQKIADIATLGMPAPLRSVFASRLGSLVLVLLIPALLVTGILTVEWQDGRPRFKFDRERAKEVREELPKKFADESGFARPQFAERGAVAGDAPSAPLLSLPEQLPIPKPAFNSAPPAEGEPRFSLPALNGGNEQSSERPRVLTRVRDILDPNR